jgi:hypothetical protein
VPPPPGRKDPCGTSSCGGTAGFNSHAALVYWGHENSGDPGPDGVTRQDDDDNVHGYPSVPPGPRPPPRSHADPYNPLETGIRFVNLRGNPTNSNLYHVRVELTPTRPTIADAALRNTSMRTEVWIEGDATQTDKIAAMKDTTRPMSLLYPRVREAACGVGGACPTDQTCDSTDNFCYSRVPKIFDAATLYDVQEATCVAGVCPAGQACGSDNMCYRPPLERIQLGFTNSQRTSDQRVDIIDFFTTWLP